METRGILPIDFDAGNGAFRIPDCQKSVQKQGMLPLDFEGGNYLMSGGGSTFLLTGHSCSLGSLQHHEVSCHLHP